MIRGLSPHAPPPFARLLASAGLLIPGFITLASCGGEGGGAAVVTAESIALTSSGSTVLGVGQSVTLYVHASNANGTRIPAFSGVTWSSSNPTVASVTKADTTATVTGVAAGESVISATVKAGVVAQATIRVGSVGVIAVAPTAVVFAGYRSSSVAAQNVVITNAGAGALASLTATPSAPWLQASFVDGNATPNPTATLRLQPSIGALSDGTYNATVTLTSSTPGVASKIVPVTLQVAATPTAFKIEAVSAPSQGGSAGQPVSQPPSVIVRAVDNTPVPGVVVTFAVSGGGSINPTGTVTTNASGVAALASWTLGTQQGASQTVTASSPGLAGSPLTFTATALSASKLIKVSGDTQVMVRGRPLLHPVVVRVTDPNDVPVPNATVTFTASAGASVAPATATTNASGQASAVWTPAETLGLQTLTASLVGPQGAATVTFTATITGATTIVKVSGDGQQSAAGTVLPQPVAVRATGVFNEPVKGETVIFSLSGGGSVSPASAQTDANGVATARWTLGPAEGAQSLVASIVPTTGTVSVTFTATASQALPSGIVILAGNNQTGRASTALPQQIVARVVNTVGAPIPGATITFTPATGSGQSFSPVSGVADANGDVRTTWTLGSAMTAYSATVTSPGLAATTINATAALPPPNVGVFTGGATKVPTGGAPGAADQAVLTYSGPASGEVPLGAGGGFTTPTLPPGTYTLAIVSKAGTFVTTSVFNSVLTAGQITSLGTIPVAYSGSGTVDISLHACSQVGDANGTATLRLYNGINGDVGGAPVHTWTSPFGTSAPRAGVAYGIYTLIVTGQHNTDASKTCAVYRTIVQHSATTTGATTILPILTMTNP